MVVVLERPFGNAFVPGNVCKVQMELREVRAVCTPLRSVTVSVAGHSSVPVRAAVGPLIFQQARRTRYGKARPGFFGPGLHD